MPYTSTPSHCQFTDYWDRFYLATPHLKPSRFATHAAQQWLTRPLDLLEIGCGNGRDAVWFAGQGHSVLGVDLSEKAIEACRNHNSTAEFQTADFSNLSLGRQFSAVYSRFNLHSIDDETEAQALNSVYEHLKPGGKFMVEARTIHDTMMGQGERISEREWIHESHYRRFLDPEQFLDNVRAAGFIPEYTLVSAGLAPWGNADPVVMRVMMRRD